MVARAAVCHHVVLLGEAQFTRGTYQNYCELPFGKVSIPLIDKGRRPLDEIRPMSWQTFFHGMCAKMISHYPPSRYLDDFIDYFIGLNCESVLEYGFESLRYLLDKAQFKSAIVVAKTLVPIRPTDPSEWIAELGSKLGGAAYFCSESALTKYLDVAPFYSREIQVVPQVWNCVGPAYISAIDCLVTQGPYALRERILSGYLA